MDKILISKQLDRPSHFSKSSSFVWWVVGITMKREEGTFQ